MIYFNNAAKARFDPTVVATGMSRLQQEPWELQQDDTAKDVVRQLFGRLIGASGSDISVMPSTAFAITLAAMNVCHDSTRAGGKILILQDQYPSAVYPWQDLCASATDKFALEIVPYPQEDETWTSLILARLNDANDDICVACLPPLFWCDGTVVDLNVIGPVCKQKGIVLIVDATQAVGIYPVDVQRIQPALLACSTHKWLRGPAGTCLVYVDPDYVAAWQPLDQHDRARDWHGRSVADRDTLGPTGYPADFLPGARKFDSGGRTQPILMPMLQEALEKVVQINVCQAQGQLRVLMQPLYDWASDAASPVHPLPPRQHHAAHIWGVRPRTPLTTPQMLAMVQRLQDEFGIVVSVRCGIFRIAPYLDNTSQDVQHLVEALSTVLKSQSLQEKQESSVSSCKARL